ncbi:MAG: metallophosphoesterase [Bryobacterales bacterium]|nr:metallophosphoesterase [Bryobacterales bacterium]
MTLCRAFAVGVFALAAWAQNGKDLGAVSTGPTVRVVGIGDFGYEGGDSGRQAVARAIQKRNQQYPFQIGLTVGDNFYPSGVSSDSDPIWKKIWETDYGPIRVPFFASLGNHDYDGNEQAQIEYEKKSATWRMPGRYYTFQAGPVRFFALDTDEGTARRWYSLWERKWSAEQAEWLKKALTQYKDARWKVVYGHHPVYSDGEHGDTSRMIKQLLPILREQKVDVYLAGHDHDLQYHVRDGLHFAIVGGGGKDTRSITQRRAEFAAAKHGYLDLSASEKKMTLQLIAGDGKELFSKTIEK